MTFEEEISDFRVKVTFTDHRHVFHLLQKSEQLGFQREVEVASAVRTLLFEDTQGFEQREDGRGLIGESELGNRLLQSDLESFKVLLVLDHFQPGTVHSHQLLLLRSYLFKFLAHLNRTVLHRYLK